MRCTFPLQAARPVPTPARAGDGAANGGDGSTGVGDADQSPAPSTPQVSVEAPAVPNAPKKPKKTRQDCWMDSKTSYRISS